MLNVGAHASVDFIKRFRIEASAAAALQHPNIVAIHEVGVHEGEHFLVMDYVDGPNLAKSYEGCDLAVKSSRLMFLAQAVTFKTGRIAPPPAGCVAKKIE